MPFRTPTPLAEIINSTQFKFSLKSVFFCFEAEMPSFPHSYIWESVQLSRDLLGKNWRFHLEPSLPPAPCSQIFLIVSKKGPVENERILISEI